MSDKGLATCIRALELGQLANPAGQKMVYERISDLEAEVERLKHSAKESQAWESDETRALKEAIGVKMEGQNNIGLAPRDYEVTCETRDLVVRANGYFIWWCSSHNQPHPWCENGKAEHALRRMAQEIERLQSRERLWKEMLTTVLVMTQGGIVNFHDLLLNSGSPKDTSAREELLREVMKSNG